MEKMENLNRDLRGRFSEGYGRKYSLDQNYFEKIDSQEKAYFLGFLYADGYVTKEKSIIRLNLQKRDKEILERFKILLKTKNPLYKTHEGKTLILSIWSKKIKQDLIDKGCMPQKTFKLTFPHWLNEDLKKHFIRGFVDGDGSVFLSSVHKQKILNVSIVGRENFLKSILKISKIKGHIRKYTYHKIYHLGFHCSFAVVFCNWIYKDATIYLKRKHDKFLEYLIN